MKELKKEFDSLNKELQIKIDEINVIKDKLYIVSLKAKEFINSKKIKKLM